MNKDCFDNCANTQCWRYGHDCIPFEECGFIPIDEALAMEGCKMDIKEYEKESARTMAPRMYDGVFIPETLHGIIGISTEAGELLDAVKKGLFYGHAPDMKNIREELGDIMWYLFAILRAENWDLEEIMQENIDKLRLRYPEQFTTKHAEIRLDKEKVKGFCDGCLYLQPSEEEQTKDKEHHWCTHFKIRLMHGKWHPDIPMPWDTVCTHYIRGGK